MRLLIASEVRPSWVRPKSILDGGVLEIPQNALAMAIDEAEQVLDGARSELTSGLVSLAGGWPAVVGLAGMTPDAPVTAADRPRPSTSSSPTSSIAVSTRSSRTGC